VKLLVIGAGAIGCLVGGKLALAGDSVTLVGRPRFADAVAAQGLRLQSDQGEALAPLQGAVGSIAAAFVGAPAYDLAILTVKSYDTANALQELQAAVGKVSALPPILSLQNGVGNEERIVAQLGADFGAERLLAGTLTTPVSVLAPAQIRIDRPSFTLGLSGWTQPFSTQPMRRSAVPVSRRASIPMRAA
jgi:2-dehydropantoate 2-reductase